MRDFWTKTPVVVLAAAFCCILWGSAPPCIKIGYELFGVSNNDVFSCILFAGLRFVLAGAMVIVTGSLQQGHFLRPSGPAAWGKISVLMLFQTVLQYILFYVGVAHTSGVRASIINALGTFIAIAISVCCFHFEHMTAAKVLGSIAGFLGVLLIVTNGEAISGAPVTFAGEGLLFLSKFASSFAACFIKLFSKKEDPVTMSGWQFFCGGFALILIGIFGGGRLVPNAAACLPLILYMGFISAFAYTVWGILLKYNEVSRISVLGFMNPVFGVLISALVLHEGAEAANIYSLLALLLVVLGIVIVNRQPNAGKRTQ